MFVINLNFDAIIQLIPDNYEMPKVLCPSWSLFFSFVKVEGTGYAPRCQEMGDWALGIHGDWLMLLPPKWS